MMRFQWGLLLGLCLALPVCAAPDAKPSKPAAKAKATYIPVRVFKTSAEAEGFLDLAKRKQVADEDNTVLARLLAEKESEIKQLEAQLLRDFGIQGGVEYEYDSDKKTVFTKRTDKDGGVTRDALREFKHPESEQDFLKLVAAKRLTLNAISTLRLLVLEKDKEMELIDQRLEKNFSVLAKKNYYYDASKLTLFEVQGGT